MNRVAYRTPAASSQGLLLAPHPRHTCSILGGVLSPSCPSLSLWLCLRLQQVEGSDGTKKLMVKFRAHGPAVFYHGAMAAFAANLLGHYPWYDTCMICFCFYCSMSG